MYLVFRKVNRVTLLNRHDVESIRIISSLNRKILGQLMIKAATFLANFVTYILF